MPVNAVTTLQRTTTKIMAKYSKMTEAELREIDVCPGCLGPKGAGLIVCWPCFKYKEPAVPGLGPLKYTHLSVQEWLEQVETHRTGGAL